METLISYLTTYVLIHFYLFAGQFPIIYSKCICIDQSVPISSIAPLGGM